MTQFSRALLATLFALRSVSAQGSAPTLVPDEPTCPRCTITMRTLVMLGTDDGTGSLERSSTGGMSIAPDAT